MLTEEVLFNLESHGYKEVPYPRGDTRVFIKGVSDNVGKRYYIEVKASDWGEPFRVAMDAEVYFERDGQKFTVKLQNVQDQTLNQVEGFFENVWQLMGCHYYEKWRKAEESCSEN